MPIRYRIDPKRGLVLTTATGVLTDDELLAHKRKLRADPDFRPDMCELSDVRQVTRLEVTPQGVQQFVEQDKSSEQPNYRLAIVARADVVFGMARMYQTLTEKSGTQVGVFRDLETAEAWLFRRSG